MKESDKVYLTQLSNSAGCAAKLKATELMKILKDLPQFECDKLEAGFDGAEDACAYDLNGKDLLISTVDFFPAMVDDPFTFGQIAAANALSDIYAMGARPLYALSLMCFPQRLDKKILKDILRGGIDKCAEAGIPIAGGHTIDDEVPKYGLCVTGIVDKKNIWRNNGCQKFDNIVLTKSLGVGIINTAVKCRMASADAEKQAIESMSKLNKYACEIARKYDVHSATDVTGFGLLGHLMEMAEGKKSIGISIQLDSKKIPYFKASYELAEMGLLPAGLYNNREYTKGKVNFAEGISLALQDIMYDPQTSGGLLLSMSKSDADLFIKEYPEAKIIGKVVDKSDSLINVI